MTKTTTTSASLAKAKQRQKQAAEKTAAEWRRKHAGRRRELTQHYDRDCDPQRLART